MINKCKICGKDFQAVRYWQLYCSKDCQKQGTAIQRKADAELLKKVKADLEKGGAK